MDLMITNVYGGTIYLHNNFLPLCYIFFFYFFLFFLQKLPARQTDRRVYGLK